MNTSIPSSKSSTKPSTKQTHKSTKSNIPIRLTRAQRLANQKRQQQYNPETPHTPHTPHLPHTKHKSSTSLTLSPSVSRLSHSSSPNPNPNTNPSTSSTISKNIPSTHIEKMIHELTMLFYSAHYAKVEKEYIQRDSYKTWNAKSIYSIPIPEEENREGWIQQHMTEYPLTMADMMTRGAFYSQIPSEFPTVEVFRQSYMDTHAMYTHDQTPLWVACGSPFSITNYPRVHWDTVKLVYDTTRTKKAIQSCLQKEPTWYFHFWKYHGNELKQFGYTRPSSIPSVSSVSSSS